MVWRIRSTLEDAQEQQVVNATVVETLLEFCYTLHRLVQNLEGSDQQRLLLAHDHQRVYSELCNLFRHFLVNPVFTDPASLTIGFIPVLATSAKNIHSHFALSERLGLLDSLVSPWLNKGVMNVESRQVHCNVRAVMSRLRDILILILA